MMRRRGTGCGSPRWSPLASSGAAPNKDRRPGAICLCAQANGVSSTATRKPTSCSIMRSCSGWAPLLPRRLCARRVAGSLQGPVVRSNPRPPSACLERKLCRCGHQPKLTRHLGVHAEPYATNEELPDSVQNVLPPHAQDIFREAFNNAWGEWGGEESRAFRFAWAAVKRECAKHPSGR
jgi:cation transport regulator